MSFGPYAYSNNGMSCRAVPAEYTPVSGEVIFSDMATPTQLTNAFPGYAAAAAVETAKVAAQDAISAGVQIESTGNRSLNGTYSCTPTATANINAVSTYIQVNNAFPGPASSMAWMDQGGEPHLFSSTAEFQAFATAIANYVAVVTIYGDSGGADGSLPSPNATIM